MLDDSLVLLCKYRTDRVTIQERDKMAIDEEKEEEKKKKLMEERRRTSRKVRLIIMKVSTTILKVL